MKVSHQFCHSTLETSSSLEPYRYKSGNHLVGEYMHKDVYTPVDLFCKCTNHNYQSLLNYDLFQEFNEIVVAPDITATLKIILELWKKNRFMVSCSFRGKCLV